MTAVADAPAPPKKRSKLPLILGVVLALAGGGGGFMAVRLGLLGGGAEPAEPAAKAEAPLPELAPTAFVPLPTLTANLVGGTRALRFTGELEVAPEHAEEVTELVPRVVDAVNAYLRAVTPADLADPAALMAIRSQLLRRAQAVAGGERVRDLLIMEFVVN